MDIKELNVNKQQDTSKNHPWEYARAKVVKDILRKHISHEEFRNPYVVDIGCGDIFFLNQFCESYPEVRPVAVDTAFDKDIIVALSQKYDKIKVDFFNDIGLVDLHGEKAKVVFLMDVIEHIEKDKDFLTQLLEKDFIDHNTIILITVPAFNKLYCAHDKWLGHYRRYNQKMLKETTAAAGLKWMDGGYFFTSLLIPRLIQKGIESIKKSEKEVSGIGGWNGGAILSKCYEWVLLCDYYFFKIFKLFGIKVPGLSTYALCKQ